MKALVIVARGFPLSLAGCYGNPWVATPHLDKLASEAVVFDQHFADHPSAAGARRGWRSGCHAFPPPDPSALPGASSDLLDLLRAASIATNLIVDVSRPAPADFADGWDQVQEITGKKKTSPLECTLAALRQTLKRCARRKNWLVWVDLGTMLPSWEVPEEFLQPYFEPEPSDDEEEDSPATEDFTPLCDPKPGPLEEPVEQTYQRLQRTAAGAASYLDAGLGEALEALTELGLAEETLVLFTADRGWPLGEHGLVGEYRPWLHEELIHVPLILRLPGQQEAGRRVSALTQTIDVMPTLLDAFGLPLPRTHGFSLLPFARGDTSAQRPLAACGLQVDHAIEWALRTPEWLMLLPIQQGEGDPPRMPRLHVKPDDRWEVNDLRQQHLDLAEQLEQDLRTFVASCMQSGQ